MYSSYFGFFVQFLDVLRQNRNVVGSFTYNILNSQQLKINEIDYYYYFKNRRWDLVFSSGLTLKLPAKNKKDSIKIFKTLIDNDKLTNTKIIDLRVSNQIIMTNNNE